MNHSDDDIIVFDFLFLPVQRKKVCLYLTPVEQDKSSLRASLVKNSVVFCMIAKLIDHNPQKSDMR